jgi:glycosyltransferase involved in cell wall biosynthesis
MGYDMSNPQWDGKRKAIEYASSFMAISKSTLRDLIQFHPHVEHMPTEVTYCGCDFRFPGTGQVDAFKTKYGIERPYFLISGSRDGPKNARLFFKAFELLGAQRAQLAIVCTNANTQLDAEHLKLVGPAAVHMLVLSDAELQCAYSGALALAYPSRYEGFGLPVVEAMACKTPAITCLNSSLPEVGGEAVIYVDPDSVEQMHKALTDVQTTSVRQALIQKGLAQASLFSWLRMSNEVGAHLANRALTLVTKAVS